MLLAGLGMCLYFLTVYQPLSRRAAALDKPLLELWTEYDPGQRSCHRPRRRPTPQTR